MKHSLNNNYISIVTVVMCNDFKRAVFQYKGEQPMKCHKIRVDPLSIEKVKLDINVKSKK